MRAMRLTVDLNGEGWTPETMRTFKARIRSLIADYSLSGGVVDVLFPRGETMMDKGMPNVGFVVVVREVGDCCVRCGRQWEDHVPSRKRGWAPLCYAGNEASGTMRYLSTLTAMERQQREAAQDERESPVLPQG